MGFGVAHRLSLAQLGPSSESSLPTCDATTLLRLAVRSVARDYAEPPSVSLFVMVQVKSLMPNPWDKVRREHAGAEK